MISLLIFGFTFAPEFISAKTLSRSFDYQNQTRRVFLDENEAISFLAIGDWGSRRDHQDEVARAMGLWCSQVEHNCDFIISTGDNIYDSGVSSATDHHFDDTWRDVYTYPGIADLPWYLTVGNHDHVHRNGEWHQVEYSLVNNRWNMPSLAFAFEIATQETKVKFVSIDTVSIDDDKNGAAGMIKLLSDELESADDDGWKIVFGHFPVHSGGHYGGSDTLRDEVLPIMKGNNVDFYVTGHDHNQQHWVERGNSKGVEHITTGAGGKSRYHQHSDTTHENEKLGMELKHFFVGYGFAHFVVMKDKITVKLVDIYGDVAHTSVRFK